MRPLKITVGLLLLIQALHLASPQFDPSWQRGESEELQQDYSSGFLSGQGEMDNVVHDGSEQNATAVESPQSQNGTVEQIELRIMDDSAAQMPVENETVPRQVDQTDVANANESTSVQQDGTSPPGVSNSSNAAVTTAAPANKASSGSPAPPANTAPPANPTVPVSKAASAGTDAPAAATPQKTTPKPNAETTPTTAWKIPTTLPAGTGPASTTRPAASTAAGDASDRDGGSGDNEDRAEGSSVSDHRNKARQQAWGAVLATAVAVAFVGLVAYIVMKRKYPKGFSHRKLVEEFPSDPVLRLDNSPPLDLNFQRTGYHNPGLQGDDIQMGNIPRRH